MNKIEEMLKMVFNPTFRNAEDGVSGGAPAAPVADAGGEPAGDMGGDAGDPGPVEGDYDIPDDMGIPEAELKEIIENDPAYKSRLIEKKKASAATAADDSNKGAEGDPLSKDKDSGAAKDEAGASVDDKNSDASHAEFEDNVIDGLKGADFAKLPAEAQEAIGKFYTEQAEIKSEYEKTKSQLETLLEDPVVKSRVDLLSAGKTQFDLRGFTAAEKASIMKSAMDKYGLDETEAQGLYNDLSAGIQRIAQDMAQDMAHNTISHTENQRRAMEVSRKGQELVLGLAEFNPDLAVKETDLNKFYTRSLDGKGWAYNEKHPEIEKFKKGIGAAQTLYSKFGIDYSRALEMGKKKLYAIAADEFGWPVAFNTEKRDQKMAAEIRRKTLDPFIRKGARGLDSHNSAPAERAASETLMVDGFDAVRLASDSDYYSRAAEKVPSGMNPSDWLEKLSEISAKGSEYRKTKKR